MEQRFVDKSLVSGLVSSIWINLWLGFSVFIFFSSLSIGWAVSLSVLALFIYRAWEATFAKLQNTGMDAIALGLRNVAASELLRSGEASNLSDALSKADRLMPLREAGSFRGASIPALVTGLFLEIAWLAACGYGGLKLSAQAQGLFGRLHAFVL
jgi:hypothetical protein